MSPIIRVENLSYAYTSEGRPPTPTPALAGVNLSIEQGEYVVILGHNGSGKSTLAKHLNALLLPGAGDVWVRGWNTRDAAHTLDIRRTVGMVFQHPDNQIIATVVEEDVAFGPENLGVPRPEILRRVDWSLDLVEMGAYRSRAPHQLSGGQKQRICIAGVLAMQPDVLVLDEATAMLDPLGRQEVLAVARRLNREQGVTVVAVTHFMREALDADRIVIMDGGRIALEGPPRTIFQQGEQLRELHLDAPHVSALAATLHQRFPAFPADLLTVDEVVAAVKVWRAQRRQAARGLRRGMMGRTRLCEAPAKLCGQAKMKGPAPRTICPGWTRLCEAAAQTVRTGEDEGAGATHDLSGADAPVRGGGQTVRTGEGEGAGATHDLSGVDAPVRGGGQTVRTGEDEGAGATHDLSAHPHEGVRATLAEELIRVEHLAHYYMRDTPLEVQAISDVNLTVRRGEILGVLGHTGSGKSTAIQHLNALLRPHGGSVVVLGQNTAAANVDVRAIRRRVGLVFQLPEAQLFEQYVGDDIAYGPRKLNLGREEVRKRVRRAMEAVGLPFEEFKDRLTFRLSGGQMRRVALAGVLALEPEVLVLDEPTAGLDPQARRQLMGHILALAERGITLVIISHNMEEMAEICDRLVVIAGGRTVLEGTPAQVFGRPAELRALGLDAPDMTQVAEALAGAGLLPPDLPVYTLAQAVEAISDVL